MIKKSKLVFGVLTSMTLIFSSVATCFADQNVVSKTQDNITVTKTAQWTTVDGKSTDASGNKYVKIDFKIDTTKATTEIQNTVSKGGDTDIVLVLDDSGSMWGNRVAKLKSTCTDFVDTMLSIPDTKVRLGIVCFRFDRADNLCGMTSDANALKQSLNGLTATSGADNPLHLGIQNGRQLLNGSTATNKFFVVLSDGGIWTYSQSEELSKKYIAEAELQYPGLKTISIGFEPDSDRDQKFMESICSKHTSGAPMYYPANVTASTVISDLGDVFKQISETITKYVVGNSLVDTIPAQFNIVDGTIKTNDSNLCASLSEDKKTITWNWGENKLEKKVYEASVITVLDKSQVPAEYTMINTNGTTIDPSADSSKSAIFSYGSTSKIYLESPKLSLAETVVDEEAPLSQPTVEEDAEDVDTTPKTADEFNSMIFVVLGVCGVVAVSTGVMAARKRRYN